MQNSKSKVLAAMSGGVDSSVAAALMVDRGYHCSGATFKLYNFGSNANNSIIENAVLDAGDAAAKLGIEHRALNFAEAFRSEVILPFIETYEKGFTPNPCIYCNRRIKFSPLIFNSPDLDFDYFVTGHYARVEKAGDRFLLKKAVDPKKDQSYVLSVLDQKILSRVFFPLGDLKKSEVREIAKAKGFSNANKKESQDICFVPEGDYAAFIEEYSGKNYPEGDILDQQGEIIGRHRGLIRYTLGQRRGLGVAVNYPVYVCAKDTVSNTVTLGPEASLYSKSLVANKLNLIAVDNFEKPTKVKVKTRYLQQEHSASAVQIEKEKIRIDFDEPQRALTPGQAAVLYDGDIVLGSGIIEAII